MRSTNPNTRLEALCDGVFAIAMTLLILDVRLPETQNPTTTTELWRALHRLGPSVFAFVLSFGVILTTWVNHHAILKLVDGTSGSFIYANGLLLLTVVSLPFPTTLLSTFLLTDHVAPAVVLYNAVLASQAIAWILVGRAVLNGHLAVDERAAAEMRVSHRHAFGALVLYTALAVTALWWPLTVAVVTTVSWAFWLVRGMRMKHA